MLIFALSGIVFASLAIRKSRGIYRREKINPFVHVLRKTVPSLMVLAASLWILFTGEFLADYLSGAIIGFFVIFESVMLFRDAACLLLGVKKSETCLFKN
jgi:Co/Zn/Cd efflux system component